MYLAHGTDAVDVSGHDMTTEASVRRHRAFQIHAASLAEVTESGAAQAFMHDVCRKVAAAMRGDGKADTIDGNAVSVMHIG